MTVDEWAIRDTARDLATLYRELNAAKHTRPQPTGERVMRPTPGPRMPGNWLMIALDADLVDRLVEYVVDIRNRIAPAYTIGRDGAELCNWLAFNAGAIAELDFADDLHDELTEQARRITRRLHPHNQEDTTPRPEQPQSAQSICARLHALGHNVSRDLLRKWADRGHITRTDGPAYYMSNVLAWIQQKDTTQTVTKP